MTRDEVTQAQSGWETNMAALQKHTLAQGKFAWQMLWTGGNEDGRGSTCPGQRRSFPPTFTLFFTRCTNLIGDETGLIPSVSSGKHSRVVSWLTNSHKLSLG
jgi:hypothetical protein